MEKLPVSNNDPWQVLKQYTDARIAMGRAGNHIPLQHSLAFKLAHAHARDAVYAAMETESIISGLQQYSLPVLTLQSQAAGREQYLQRPDLGRLLEENSASRLQEYKAAYDIVLIVADGLSATAVNQHAVPLVNKLLQQLTSGQYKMAPVCLAVQARVALADAIGYALGASLSLVLIGERPGLSASDSLGAYITYDPRPGRTDEGRNCVSNIRPGGLGYDHAAYKIAYLIREAVAGKKSGVQLKDHAGELPDAGIS